MLSHSAMIFGALAQMGEHLSGRQKVTGSIPVGSTNIWPGRLVARIPPFQGVEAGSKPVRATKKKVDNGIVVCYNENIESETLSVL